MRGKSSIGSVKKLSITEIRKLWSKEEVFSRWLAENVHLLNDTLKLNIEIMDIEAPVETFKLDLFGIDATSRRVVVIENQFGRSNHDHLGKLLTYAANKEAGIIVWIANEFRSAHRKVIEWLNQISPPELLFYAVELEVLRIDKSRPAPYFRAVSSPSFSKIKEGVERGEISPRNKRYQRFFEAFRRKLLELEPNFTRAKALPQSWWSLGIGRTGFSLSAAFTGDGKFRIEIYIDTGVREENKQALAKLEENRSELEGKIGQPLIWDYLPESRASRVYVAVDGTIDEGEEKLQQLIEWGVPMMIKFKKAFAPLIKRIDIETE